MKAILETLCGCKREMEIPYPPNPRIIVPIALRIPVTEKLDDIAKMVMPQRTFELDYTKSVIDRGPFFGIAHYIERWERR